MDNNESEDIKNIINIKKINEDNILDIEDISEEYDDINDNNITNNNINSTIRYKDILDSIRNNEEKDYNRNEFLCNLLLYSSDIDIYDKLSSLYLLTNSYKDNDKKEQIYKIARTFEQNVQYLKDVDPTFFIYVFYRAAYCYKNDEQYIYAMKYINKTVNIIDEYIQKQEKEKFNFVEKYYQDISINLTKYIKNAKINFTNNRKFFTSEKCKNIKQIVDLILEAGNNSDINDEVDDYIFAINKIWLIKLKYFLEDYLISEDTKIQDLYFDKAFDFAYFFNSYFDNDFIIEIYNKKNVNMKTIKFTAFPGPINNYYISSFKDYWNDNMNADENYYIKKDLKLNEDYCLINQKVWNILNTYFGSTNEILRKNNNIDLIQLKFIVFDIRINTEKKNINLLKIKYIQINKNLTLKQLKEKIIKIINDNLEKKEFDHLNFNNSSSDENINDNEDFKNKQIFFYSLNKEKKDLLIEICYSFYNKNKSYESIYINKLEFNDDINMKDFFIKFNKYTHILLIEIIDNNKSNFFTDLNIKMKNEYKCTMCNKKIKINEKYNCNLCNYSLFCSKHCAENSIEHVNLDKKLKTIKQLDFNLPNLLSLELESLLKGNGAKGIVGLKNIGNTSFINSCIQCLSHTEDLTKYFLNGDFLKEINNNSENELSKAYYKLIKKMWKGKNDLVETEEFIANFVSKGEIPFNNEEIDAQKFILSLLNNLHSELNRVIIDKEKQNKKIAVKQKNENDKQASDRYWKYYKSNNNSIIVDLFRGQYKSYTKCMECGKSSISFDTYINLDLPIPSKKVVKYIKLCLSNGDFVNLSIHIDEKTEIKDIIKKGILYLDNKKYFDYINTIKIKNNIFNYNNTKAPENLLYNNLIVVEFDYELKINNIYKTSYNNYDNNKNNQKMNINININNKKNAISSKNLIIDDDKNIIDDKKKILNIYEKNKNIELVLFEKNMKYIDKNNVDIFVYPIIDEDNKNILEPSSKIIRLSYPIIISLNKNSTLNELKIAIFEKFSKILKEEYNSESKNILICFPHFSEKWHNLNIGSKKCPICDEPYSKKVKYCLLSTKLKKTLKISYLINKIGEDKPLIIYAKSQVYDLYSELYQNLTLRSFIKETDKKEKDNISIYDSLELFNTEEIIFDDLKWFCDECNKNVKCKKTFQIYKTPYYLIIHLKRFNNKKKNSIFGSKNDIFVDYPEILNLRDFIIGPEKEKSIYYLYGVVCHKKLFNHYYSFCKNRGIWIMLDDKYFDQCTELINKEAYLLFYRRKNF